MLSESVVVWGSPESASCFHHWCLALATQQEKSGVASKTAVEADSSAPSDLPFEGLVPSVGTGVRSFT